LLQKKPPKNPEKRRNGCLGYLRLFFLPKPLKKACFVLAKKSKKDKRILN
jgi:hypothetical protein